MPQNVEQQAENAVGAELIDGNIEFGVFDLNRLPVLWDNFSTQDIATLQRNLERTKERQVRELKHKKKKVICKDVSDVPSIGVVSWN